MARHRMEPDERRATILRAARQQFSTRPYAEVAVADIARAASSSPGLVLFYFGSKHDLYLAVLHAAAGAVRSGLRDLPGPPSMDRLRAGVRFYAEYARSHRTGFLSLLRGGYEAAVPGAAAVVETLRAEITEQILSDLAAADPETAGPGDGRPRVATVLAVHGYIGYVDAMIVRWLSLPEEQRRAADTHLLADLAVGAFTGSLDRGRPGNAVPDSHG